MKFLEEAVGFNLKRKIYSALLEDDYADSLKFAKMMEDMETDSNASRDQAKKNLS